MHPDKAARAVFGRDQAAYLARLRAGMASAATDAAGKEGQAMTGNTAVTDVTGGLEVGTNALDCRVVIRAGLDAPGAQAALTVQSARILAELVLAQAAGIQGRKALALAVIAGGDEEAGFRDSVRWIHGVDGEQAEDLDDSGWVNVERVLLQLPHGFGDLRWFWDQAGEALSGD